MNKTLSFFTRKTVEYFLKLGFSIFIMVFLITGNIFAQIEDCRTIGIENIADNDFPFTAAFGTRNSSYLQQIYTAAELLEEGIINEDLIKAISFNYFWENPTTRPIKIFMGNTSSKDLSSEWIPMTDLEEVFSSNCHEFSRGSDDWTKISFPTSFKYTGKNIVVAVLMNKQDATHPEFCFTEASSTNRFYVHKASKGMSRYEKVASDFPITFHPNSGKPKTGNKSINGELKEKRSNIKFCKDASENPKVSAIRATNIEGNSITLDWIKAGLEQSWTIEYGQTGFSLGQGSKLEVTSHPAEITGLSGASTYDFYVKANYSENDVNQWAGPKTYNTLCGYINSQNYIEKFNKDNFTLECWTIIDVENNGEDDGKIGKWRFYSPRECARYMHLKNNQTANDWLVSPKLHFTEELALKFDYSSQTKSGKFSVWAIKGDNPEDLTNIEKILDTKTVGNPEYLKTSAILLKSFKDQPFYIGIKCESDTESALLEIDNFEIYMPSSEKDITSFYIPEHTASVEIDNENNKINIITSIHNTSLESLTPIIKISPLASISPSSNTAQNFTTDVEYVVTAEDGSYQTWTVSVIKADSESKENMIKGISFEYQEGGVDINDEDFIVKAEINWKKSLTNISPIIKISPFATISPASGTPQDFSSEDGVEYTVYAENGDPQVWKVIISNAAPPQGVNCENPVILNLTELDIPHSIIGETTKGFGNAYDKTVLDKYDDGEDKIYKLNTTKNEMYTIKLNTQTKFVGMAVFKGCPSENKMLVKKIKNSVGERSIDDIILDKNEEYFLMVDKRGKPKFIESYDLTFEKNENPPCLSPTNLEVKNILPNSASVTWSEKLEETEWELSFGVIGHSPGASGTILNQNISSPYELTNLSPDTEYSIYIHSICSAESIGKWVGPINFTTLEPCPKPTNLSISSITTNSAEITWESVIATAWTLEYKLSSEENFQSVNVNQYPFTLTGLNAASSYTIRVKSKCEETEESSYSDNIEFFTLCDIVSEFPYFEEFTDNSESIKCWTIIDEDGNGNDYIGKWNFTENQAYFFAKEESAKSDWLISPKMSIGNDLKLRFDYNYNGTSDTEQPTVWIIKDSPSNYENADKIFTIKNTDNNEYVSTNMISLEVYQGQNIYIGIKCKSGAKASRLWIDNFNVFVPSSENDITEFTLATQTGNAKIDKEHHKVDIEVGNATGLTNLSPTITVSQAATINPESGIPQDFSNGALTYKVIAENGNEQDWTVTVKEAINPSSEKDILSFTFPDQVGDAVIELSDKTVTAVAKWNQDLAAITPSIGISLFASIDPVSESPQNFTSPFKYKIKAQDGSDQDWTVTITNDDTHICTSAFSTPFSETFSGNSNSVECWNSLESNESENRKGAWRFNLNDGDAEFSSIYSGLSDTRLISPKIYVGDNASLVFDYRIALYSGGETFSVWVIPSTPLNTESPQKLFEQITSESKEWHTINAIPLTDFANKEVYLYIKFESEVLNDYSGLHIQNFKVDSEVIKYKITSSAGENGEIKPLGEKFVEQGSSFSYTIKPKPGYEIDKIMVDDNNEFENLIENSIYTFNDVDSDHTIIATFKVKTHTITASAADENGKIDPAGEVPIDEGKSQSFTITPNPNYQIDEVLVNGIDKKSELVGNIYTFTNVQADHKIVVSFKETSTPPAQTFTITTSIASGNGRISPSGDVSVTKGENKTFNFLPANGHILDKVLVDGNEPTTPIAENAYTFTNVQANHKLVVYFKEASTPPAQTFTITASVFGGHGTISPKSKIVSKGSDFKLTIIPDNGYEIEKIMDNGKDKTTQDIINNNIYTLSNIQDDHNIVVRFKLGNNISEEYIIQINIYPNPTNNLLNIEVSDEISQIEIMSIDGKLLDKQNVNSNKYQYNTSSLAEGNYFVRIYTENKISIKQFSVKR